MSFFLNRLHLFRMQLLALLCIACMPLHAAEPIREYRLAPGDSIQIQVFQSPDLSLATRVSEAGTITYPLIGAVKLGGLSLGEAEQAIAKKLDDGKFVIDPQVTIRLVQNVGNQVSVLGQVNSPGRFPLDTVNIRLSEIIATAGGITATGSDTVILTGVREGQSLRREIDISGMFLKGAPSDDVLVSAGDVIFVPRAPMFYIYGEVQRPGSYRRERNMDVRQALAQGGGLTPRGTERGLRIQRRNADGTVVELRPKLSDPVLGDDIIQVSESLF